ncbi:MAG: ATP-binding protein [Chitinivibrionia bacterium]|nr:ATP-binding protein [Chitinivibrionia bacterium]
MPFKKLPYGKSNFADLIEGGFAYVDKTRFVELLENENNSYQFFIRPRRFGKSLFLSVLENYYCIKQKNKFEALFGNLYIGKHPTSEQGKYAVIRFDFSGLNTDSHEEFKDSFSIKVQEAVRDFLYTYKNTFQNYEELLSSLGKNNPGIGAMVLAYTAAKSVDIPIFVIIDEYDHFANNLIAMGKSYIDEVKAGGIVRSFYESLKAGTSSVVKRIFITGISPMMINDLTSGFNMSTDYSLYSKYNEMFGFTKEEVERMMSETGVDKNLIKVDMEAYYNGYLFNEDGENKVYNSQMILFIFNQISITNKQPKQVVDTNLQTDYERLRRLAENENNRKKILQIALDGGTHGNIIEKFSLDKLESEEYFVSLFFYLGMLTIGEAVRGRPWLKIPNYSIKTLYWEYIVSYSQSFNEKPVSNNLLEEATGKMAFDGDFKSYLDFFAENYLKRLSNRDLIDFDEKYIKVMMLATLFNSRLYLPVSENETQNGYSDVYLQKHHAIKDIKFEYVFELKYIKTKATKSEKEAKFAEATAQIEKYKKDPRFIGRDDIKFVAIVFEGKGDFEAR